jgi:hypothetical protein
VAYTLGQAAIAASVSKTTLRRAIERGRISAIRRDDGSYEIDPAELHRAFPNHSDDPVTLAQSVTGPSQAEVDLLSAALRAEREAVADLRRRLDESEAERRQAQERLTALLTDQRPARRRKWWLWG